jgi:His-Xaa-Ser system protein HxsD
VEIRFCQDHIEIIVPLDVYGLDVLHKCFYWYGDEFAVDVQTTGDKTALIQLVPRDNNLIEYDPKDISDRIRNDIIDHKTRDIVTKETQNIRDLIFAKAFACLDEYESPSPGGNS